MKQFADFAGVPSGHKQGGCFVARPFTHGLLVAEGPPQVMQVPAAGPDNKKKRRAVLNYCVLQAFRTACWLACLLQLPRLTAYTPCGREKPA